MKTLFLHLCVLLLLSSCATSRKAEKAQEKASAAEAVRVSKLPAGDQLTELVTRHPELVGSITKVVVEHDTVRIPGKTVEVQVPVVSTPATDNALIDSLLTSYSVRMKKQDSLAFVARMLLLMKQRPQLSRDTSTFVFGDMTVKTWTDKNGQVRVKVIQPEQKVGYDKKIIETGPLQPPPPPLTNAEKVVLFIMRNWWWLLLILVALGLLWRFRKVWLRLLLPFAPW